MHTAAVDCDDFAVSPISFFFSSIAVAYCSIVARSLNQQCFFLCREPQRNISIAFQTETEITELQSL